MKYHPNDRCMTLNKWLKKSSWYLVHVPILHEIYGHLNCSFASNIKELCLWKYVLEILKRFQGFLDRCSLQHHRRPWRVCRGVSRRVQPVVVRDAPWTNWWVGGLHMVMVIWYYMHDICIIGLYGFGLVSLFFHIILSCARKSSCSNSIVCCCVAVEVSLLCRCVPELRVGWRNAEQVMMTLWRSMDNRIIFKGSDKNFRTALLGTGWPKGS